MLINEDYEFRFNEVSPSAAFMRHNGKYIE